MFGTPIVAELEYYLTEYVYYVYAHMLYTVFMQ